MVASANFEWLTGLAKEQQQVALYTCAKCCCQQKDLTKYSSQSTSALSGSQ